MIINQWVLVLKYLIFKEIIIHIVLVPKYLILHKKLIHHNLPHKIVNTYHKIFHKMIIFQAKVNRIISNLNNFHNHILSKNMYSQI